MTKVIANFRNPVQATSRLINPHGESFKTEQKNSNSPDKSKIENIHKPTQEKIKDDFLDRSVNWFGKYQELFLKYLIPALVLIPSLTKMKSKSLFENIFNVTLGALISSVSWCISTHFEKQVEKNKTIEIKNKNDVIKIATPFDRANKFPLVSDPRSHHGMFEHAIDFLMPIGTPLKAVANGKVIAVTDSHQDHNSTKSHIEFNPDGTIKRNDNVNEILIQQDNGLIQHYAHVRHNSAKVKVGDQVEAGAVIGESGHNGNSSQPHLHFTLFKPNRSTKELVSVPVQFVG